MATKTRVKFETGKFKRELFKNLVEDQTTRLVKYAMEEIKNIGNQIQTYNSRNHMDDTGNLLDSLCWGVSYNGKLVDYGFYRDKQASRESWLHAFSERAVAVNGRDLAEEYIQKYGASYTNGWKIFWGILAPYWGYWEKGFTMKKRGTPVGFYKFAVMTQRYDAIKRVLTPPMTKRLHIGVNKYNSATLSKPYN